jgi:hypothetical protein
MFKNQIIIFNPLLKKLFTKVVFHLFIVPDMEAKDKQYYFST